MLSNTYHLGLRPGEELLESVGGLHKLMSWPRNLLTDSGGFQMVSLLALADITEEGVTFQSPHDGTPSLLTPEKSMSIQNAIGADIMMALDDVVSSLVEGDRVREAMERTLRWIDRCIEGHKRPERQNLFGIVQGGLDSSLREICLKGLIERDLPGYAIGGLSGGESKDRFWPIVLQCTRALPPGKPRYLMGVGYPVDLVVCVALGVDMFDCVYPTRTARFGTALVPAGLMSVREKVFANDFSPVQEGCACSTCARYTRSYLHHLFAAGSQNAGILLSIHNVAYLLGIMGQMRSAIIANTFPAWVLNFMETVFPKRDHPKWVRDALQAVNITLPTEKD
jgi:tRNA-guanine transglycosylase